ncbi:MAG: sulfatase-like hydrolase/transferase [Gammaproteobacteria bacterium]|nr:sulfatase-like hydrolase/transferase [Gammaproteobacteria bacterium]
MATKRNLVFIFSDQQRYDTMACYGNGWINTPNLNALASKSTVFRNCYVTQAVCTASRGSIMTGLYPHTAGPVLNGMRLRRSVPAIAEMVSADYRCAYYGKWHLGYALAPQHGFTDWLSTQGGPRELPEGHPRRSSDYTQHLIAQGFEPDILLEDLAGFSAVKRSSLPEQFQEASFLGDRAARFIEENAQQPFVLYVSCSEPHSPYIGPLQEMYNPEDLPVGPTFLKKPEGVSRLNRLKSEYYLQYLTRGGDPGQDSYMNTWAAVQEDVTTEAGWRRLRAHYFAKVSLVDRMVGKITAALERNGLSENTAVVFTSDHGDQVGDHGMLEKRSFYEESTRVPLLISVPWGQKRPAEIAGDISHIDLVPTMLDLLEQPIPEHLQGCSRLPVLAGEVELKDNEVFIQWTGTTPRRPDRPMPTPEIDRLNALSWRSIVKGRWKLNLCAADQCELFDLASDPYEQINLFADSAQRERIGDLAARIGSWQQRTADSVRLPII